MAAFWTWAKPPVVIGKNVGFKWMRTWIWIPRTHLTTRHIAQASQFQCWELGGRERRIVSSSGALTLVNAAQWKNSVSILNRLEGEDWQLKLTSLGAVALIHTHTLTQILSPLSFLFPLFWLQNSRILAFWFWVSCSAILRELGPSHWHWLWHL